MAETPSISHNPMQHLKFYKIALTLYGILYSVWGWITYGLSTNLEPQWERTAFGVGAILIAQCLFWIGKKWSPLASIVLSNLVLLSILTHYVSIVWRAHGWGHEEFITYCFGYLIVVFSISLGLRTKKELLIVATYNTFLTLTIASNIDFMNSTLFFLFVVTMNLVVGVVSLYTHYLLDQVEASQMQNLQKSKLATIGEMTAAISHEINNSLTVISGTVELIALKNPQINLKPINKSTDRMAHILHSLRLLTTNKEPGNIKKDACNLNSELTKLIALYEVPFRELEVKFTFTQAQKNIVVNTIASDISQVIINLFNNAVDYLKTTEDRKIELEIYKDTNMVYITVQNSGEKIPEEIAHKIFLPFFSTKPINKGSGLGLSLCKKIMVNLGGDLFLDQSATSPKFTLTIPNLMPKSLENS